MKPTDEERTILDSVERAEWESVPDLVKEKRRYQTAARAAQRSARRVDTVPAEWYIFYTMEFEFDKHKSLLNRQKHGIDFDEAQLLWEDANLMIIPARTEDEPRSVIIGKIGDTYWSAVITLRGGRIRMISVRRSRKEEVELYES